MMPKFVKIFLFVVFPLFLLVGGAYGLAKIGVIPIRKFAQKSKPLSLALHLIGLDSPKLPTVQVTPASAPDPLEGQRKALAQQRAALDKERADWQAEQEAKQKPATPKPESAEPVPDPKSLSRL